jgi:ABC-type transport system involved in cytochrome bd biosynthesis fused ATPase/permease subunit
LQESSAKQDAAKTETDRLRAEVEALSKGQKANNNAIEGEIQTLRAKLEQSEKDMTEKEARWKKEMEDKLAAQAEVHAAQAVSSVPAVASVTDTGEAYRQAVLFKAMQLPASVEERMTSQQCCQYYETFGMVRGRDFLNTHMSYTFQPMNYTIRKLVA